MNVEDDLKRRRAADHNGGDPTIETSLAGNLFITDTVKIDRLQGLRAEYLSRRFRPADAIPRAVASLFWEARDGIR